MRFLHTSDWHLGRSFHGASTLPQLREVLGTIPEIVRRDQVDAVLVSGDVFDHAAPAAELYGVLGAVIREIRDAGAAVVMISGNHDNAARLGFQAEWAAGGGVHVITRPDGFRDPLTLTDAHGPIDVYAVPYLEPMLQQGLYPGERLGSHDALLGRVLEEIRELRRRRGNRSIVLSHCFAANLRSDADPEARRDDGVDAEPAGDAGDAGDGLVWDLTSGGVDIVDARHFSGHEYVALGHLHGRQVLSERVRYSGAPLHFSFGESRKPRGAWLVDLGAAGEFAAQWRAFPVPRALARLRGTMAELLDSSEFIDAESRWVEATLTDAERPIDAMRRLRERFPHCVRVLFDPIGAARQPRRTYATRVAQRTDTEIVEAFLEHVRDGVGLADDERALLRGVLAEVRSGEAVERMDAPGGVRSGEDAGA